MYKIELTYLVPELHTSDKMDNIKVGRNKKADKAKEKYERNGGFSKKHVRITEATMEKRAAGKPQAKSSK